MPESERDRIARAVIEEALGLDIAELQSAVAAARRKLADAEEKLKLARKVRPRRLKEWRGHDRLDRVVEMRALTIARIKDLADTSVPATNYVQAVHSYLLEHHPPVRQDDGESSE
ncbi:MAG TPA: hypothetical protein VHX59_12045 [Mycobacteriales bacterium]|nr:hypothetical protein [Mycobacteriales bacterium]